MPYSKANKKAVDKYCKNNYEQLMVRVKIGEKEKIQAFAAAKGKSLNGYINDLIKEDMINAD